MVGGILEIKMGSTPNKEWGTQAENVARSMLLER
jgi:putative alpha-1,2-mannosidase